MGFGKIPPLIFSFFEKEFKENKILQNYLNENKLKFDKVIAYGNSAWILVVKDNNGKKYTIKLEKKQTTRKNMVEKEIKHLKIANSINIGQKLIDYSLKGRFIVLEYIDALPLNRWILKENDEEKIKKCIFECLKQAYLLDKIHLDHGQLANTGSNIIVKKDGTPVIVDFEKASTERKVHNYNTMFSFLLKYSKIAKIIQQKIKI